MVIIAEVLTREIGNVGIGDVEIPTGYKLTELGLMPEDWSICQLRDLIDDLEAGVSVNSIENLLQACSHNLSILKTSSVSNGAFLSHECKKIHPKDIYRAKLNPRAETIIISRMNTPDLVGECGYIQQDYPYLFLPDRLWMTRFYKGCNVNAQWLNYLLNSVKFKKKIKESATGTSGSMKNISKGSLLQISIPFPDQHEQHAIAQVLSDIDSLTTNLDRLIAKKRNIKQATMQQLLTGKQRLPGFSGRWNKKQLGEIAGCYSGGTPLTSNPQYYNGDIPWITSGDLNQRYIKNVKGKITELGLNNSSAKMVKKGALLIALYGATAGVTAITKIDAAINQAILAIIPKNDHVDFLFHYFELHKNWLINTYTQGGQPNLSGDIVKSIEFPIPAFEEQTAIAQVLSAMDAEISTLEQQVNKTRNLKQGMMQELLTGRIRLV